MTSRETAYHEAGHAIACLHFGLVPTEIVANGNGGHVLAAMGRLDDQQRMIVGMAGAHAVEMLLERDESMSREDCSMADPGWRGLAARMHVRTARTAVNRRLDDLIWRHREQIELLADRLMRRERMLSADLSALVHRYKSLAMFRNVMSKPERKPVLRSRHAADKLSFEDWCRWIDAGGPFRGLPVLTH